MHAACMLPVVREASNEVHTDQTEDDCLLQTGDFRSTSTIVMCTNRSVVLMDDSDG